MPGPVPRRRQACKPGAGGLRPGPSALSDDGSAARLAGRAGGGMADAPALKLGSSATVFG